MRTFATVMAGASRMDLRVYTLYSVIGGILWGAGVTALGHWLGGVQVIRDHVELFALLVVALSLIPVALELLRARRNRAA